MTFRKLHAFGLGAIVSGVAAGLLVLVAPARRIAPEPHLPVAERLPDAARSALRLQLGAHARAALPLLSAATLLDWTGAAQRADELLAERPVPSGDGAVLPARFFALQEELRAQLTALSVAARAHDAEAMGDAVAATTRTCVRCHDAYLSGK